MKIPNKVFLFLGGGLGDHYKRYFFDSAWGCLPDLKTKRPDIYVKGISISHAPDAGELIKHHPFLDEIEIINKHPKEISKGIGEGFEKLKPIMAQEFNVTEPEIYLNAQDKIDLAKIKKNIGKYIVIHPFSGDKTGWPTRSPIQTDRYKPIIEGLIAEGFSVLLLGHTYEKRKANKKNKTIKSEHIAETFDFQMDGFYNLINKINARTGAVLVKDSDGFVGTASSFLCAAWMLGKRSVTITSIAWEPKLKQGIIISKKSIEPQNKIIYIPQKRDIQVFKNMTETTVDWFKGVKQ